jgi:L-alanine-DL-glutamate epimerase-like enolase superfamily enzyme
VDANSAWTRDQAAALLPTLADLGVEFVEQPLAMDDPEGFRWLHQRSPLPLYVDESVAVSADLLPYLGGVDGVNLKLAKTGGLDEALRLIATARACGLAVMIGCMIETSLGITSAAQLAPLVDLGVRPRQGPGGSPSDKRAGGAA